MSDFVTTEVIRWTPSIQPSDQTAVRCVRQMDKRRTNSRVQLKGVAQANKAVAAMHVLSALPATSHFQSEVAVPDSSR